eukprot:CAMPEP_0115833440 /NCGR_PEP_ID=MMETSP0287-20121206/3175_1 /TAXON_ID=412157 /ORGANISM="Chrysochromulina rotalis, Strain UIO044" /LENGTH=133 /DNA_ID=CAMNT_0003286857 /DNA_START=269 /DNA_END=667 /DNA_ORIENTATION=-
MSRDGNRRAAHTQRGVVSHQRLWAPSPDTVSNERPQEVHEYCPRAFWRSGPLAPERYRALHAEHSVPAPSIRGQHLCSRSPPSCMHTSCNASSDSARSRVSACRVHERSQTYAHTARTGNGRWRPPSPVRCDH